MDRQLRVTDDVGEQHMRDFELDLFLNFSGHPMTSRENKATDNCPSGPSSRSKFALPNRLRTPTLLPCNFAPRYIASPLPLQTTTRFQSLRRQGFRIATIAGIPNRGDLRGRQPT